MITIENRSKAQRKKSGEMENGDGLAAEDEGRIYNLTPKQSQRLSFCWQLLYPDEGFCSINWRDEITIPLSSVSGFWDLRVRRAPWQPRGSPCLLNNPGGHQHLNPHRLCHCQPLHKDQEGPPGIGGLENTISLKISSKKERRENPASWLQSRCIMGQIALSLSSDPERIQSILTSAKAGRRWLR